MWRFINRENTLLLLLFSFLSYISVVEYSKVFYDLSNIIPGWHGCHINNIAPAPLQYRVLSYMVPELISKVFHVNITLSYLFERWLFLVLSLLAFYKLLVLYVSKQQSLFISLLFIYMYSLTIYKHLQPAEELNIFFFILMYYSMVKNNDKLLFIIAILSIFNKSTTVFILPFYYFYNYFSSKKLFFKFGKVVFLGVIIFSFYFAIRYYFRGPREYLGGVWQYLYNIQGLLSGKLIFYNFLLITLIPMSFTILSWKKQPDIVKSAVLTFPFFFIGHFLISRLDEFRTYFAIGSLFLLGISIYINDKFNMGTK